MNRSFWKSLAVVVALAGSCEIPDSVRAQDAEKIDLMEITRRLTQWRDSFVNLRVVYEMSMLKTATDKPLTEWDMPTDPGQVFVKTEWIWADHGMDFFGDSWSVDVFNGPKGVVFRANYAPTAEGGKTLRQLTLRGLGVGKPISSVLREPLDGLYWPGVAMWLPEKLSEWNWKLEAVEDIDGERCARIVSKDPFYTDVDWLHILWLDLAHDCLVRRHLGPAIPDKPERRRGADFIVDEFQRLESGIWFPKRGRVQLHTNPYRNQTWEVTEVAINQSLDMSRFEPPQPVVGTIVDDGKGRVYSYGVAPPANPSSSVDGSSLGPSSTRSAVPPSSYWLWWSGGLVVVSLLCVGAGCWFWRRGKCLAVVAILALSYGSPEPARAQDADKIDLTEITRRLTEWRTSIVNLHAVWEIRSLPTTTEQPLTEWSPPDDPATGKLFLRKEWVWADHGLDYYASLSATGSKEPWSIEVFNGPKGVVFRANYKRMPDESRFLGQLIFRGVVTGKPTSSLERVPMDGLYWPGSATWLPDLLSEWKWTVEAIEEIGQQRCAKIVAKDPWFSDVEWVHILWIDLTHDYLVRRHLGPRIPERRTGRDFMVDEFQRLENGVWFPKRGRYQMEDSPYQNQSWEVTEVVLNETLDLSRFEPPTPVAGTIVDDGKGNVYMHGSAAGKKSSDPQAQPDGAPTLQNPSSIPPTSRWLWWSGGLLLASFVFLVVGLYFRHRT